MKELLVVGKAVMHILTFPFWMLAELWLTVGYIGFAGLKVVSVVTAMSAPILLVAMQLGLALPLGLTEQEVILYGLASLGLIWPSTRLSRLCDEEYDKLIASQSEYFYG